MNEARQKILMVDDDLEDQQIIQDTFADLGYGPSIHFESTGEQAISYLRDCHARHDHPCLVVLDLNMPKMNGRQVLNFLKANDIFKSIPVIIYSTSLNPLERDQCMSLGAHSYIIKPITYSQSVDTAKLFYSFCSAPAPDVATK
jgi:CheY-like chemotaxis protein